MTEQPDFRTHPDPDFISVDALGNDQARKEVEALRDAIDYHDYLY